MSTATLSEAQTDELKREIHELKRENEELKKEKSENEHLKKIIQEIERGLNSNCGYAADLVWCGHFSNASVAKQRQIEVNHPKEVKKLLEDDRNWQHGFNSGCLATSRMVKGIIHAKEIADELNQDNMEDVPLIQWSNEIEDFP